MITFLSGLGTGLILSAPIGPIGALAAYQAANKHVQAAWMLGLGACTADGILALFATWGTELPIPEIVLAPLAALLMFALAIHLWLTAHQEITVPNKAASFSVGFAATLFHPGNLVAFGVAFGWLSSRGLAFDGLFSRLMLMMGVFTGSVLMWALLIKFAKQWGMSTRFTQFKRRFQQGLALFCGVTSLVILVSLF